MKNSQNILDKILKAFKSEKVAQVADYNQFEYVREASSAVKILRENGKEANVPFQKLHIAIEGVQKNSEYYNQGPSKLRELGLTHVTSPIWAMLHLVGIEEYK